MTHESKIYFITGVCGVGKTTVIPHLKSLLNNENYDIHDFDERGVPDGADRQWRIKETEYWINYGKQNIKDNISTIICGFSNPKEIIYSDDNNIKFILLDADDKTIRQRISERYQTAKSKQELKRVSGDTVERFIEDNINFLTTLRSICEKDKRCNIIDTINKSPKKIAKQVVEIIK